MNETNDLSQKLPPNFSIGKTVKDTLTKYGKTLGETHIVYAKVYVNGVNLSKESNVEVTIHQCNLEHNIIDIICPPEVFHERYQRPLKNSEKLLHSLVTVQMIQFGLPAAIYSGRVVSIRHSCHNGSNCIIVSAKSPTILMDQHIKTRSFENMSLEDIFKKVTEEYHFDDLTFDFKPFLKTKIPYTVQNETDYQFIKRLAIRYGEWIEFSGLKMNIGGLGSKVVEMEQNRDFYAYDLTMNSVPQNFALLGYDAKEGQSYLVDSSHISTPEVSNPYQFQAIKSAKEMYPISAFESYHESLLEGSEFELEGMVERYKRSKESCTVFLTASSHNPELRLGDIVKMKVYLPDNPLFAYYPIESYRITDIIHKHDSAGGYNNHFTAVPCELQVPSYMDYKAFPYSVEQNAVVKDNNDPLKLNRVRVQFEWQKKDNQLSPWIELPQVHSGAGKGTHWIPEVGDSVLVGFKGGNAEVPYVINSLYNGQQQSGYHTPNNNLKVIKTRSGHTIILDDTDGKLSLTITDVNKNIIYFDTMAKSIKISAPETIEIIAKNLKINIEEDITTNVGRDIKTIANNNITQDSGKKTTIASGSNTEISANKELDLYGKNKFIAYTDGKTEMGAKQQMHVYGGNSLISATDKIEYKAPVMQKVPQPGHFNYFKSGEIEEIYWINSNNEKINYLSEENAGIYVKVKNGKEGEVVKIYVEESENEKKIRDLEYSGVIDSEGEVILKKIFNFNNEIY